MWKIQMIHRIIKMIAFVVFIQHHFPYVISHEKHKHVQIISFDDKPTQFCGFTQKSFEI